MHVYFLDGRPFSEFRRNPQNLPPLSVLLKGGFKVIHQMFVQLFRLQGPNLKIFGYHEWYYNSIAPNQTKIYTLTQQRRPQFCFLILTQKSRPRVVLFCFSHGRFEQGMSEQCVLLDGCSKAFVGYLRWVGANFFKPIVFWYLLVNQSTVNLGNILWIVSNHVGFSAPLEYRAQSKQLLFGCCIFQDVIILVVPFELEKLAKVNQTRCMWKNMKQASLHGPYNFVHGL